MREPSLLETREAFDSVAADYDGPRGNNTQIQEMRKEMWHWLDHTFAVPSRLIDLGCGTGLDAVRMARLGHRVTATDWSPRMVERTAARARQANLEARVDALQVGGHELQRLSESAAFDGAYSNLGPLNCVPRLPELAGECARLLKPGGMLVFTVIGRICPWEILHYARQRRWRRLAVRFSRGVVPIGMNNHTIWTRYYTPREFYRAFAQDFSCEQVRALCLFVPPPYIQWTQAHQERWHQRLWRIDRRVAGWPVLRGMGDHFLMVLKKRSNASARPPRPTPS